MQYLIDVKGLHFRYAQAAADTLQIPDFSMQQGERLFLYGPSGSGKTTFLEILAGILKGQQGSVKILGHNFSEMSDKQRDQFRAEHFGYIFQSFNLIPYLNVKENIELPLHLSAARRARVQNQNISQQVNQICERLGMGDTLDKKVTELSIGQQQRVAVARALLGQPELILADEPTSSLDSDHRERFLQLLFELCDQYGSTLLFVSHDRNIQHLFTRALSLDAINKTSAVKAN